MRKRSTIRVYSDGGARGNPGPAAIGIVLCDEDDRPLQEYKEYIGNGTNNEAEYRAVIKALDLASARTSEAVEVVCDSELVVKQLLGAYRLKNQRMMDLNAQVRVRETRFRKVSYRHSPRMKGWLARADGLVNEALDEAGL